jgi:ATP-dependent Clp protease ATP-binding subunit ClpA
VFERFTQEGARKVIILAQDEARQLDHNYIGTEHLLLGLLREEGGVAAQALSALNVDLAKVREQVESLVGPGEEDLDMGGPRLRRARRKSSSSRSERRCSSARTTSAPSTSCWVLSGRARVLRPACSPTSTSTRSR